MVDSPITINDMQCEEQTQSSSTDVNWRRKRTREDGRGEEWTEVNRNHQKTPR